MSNPSEDQPNGWGAQDAPQYGGAQPRRDDGARYGAGQYGAPAPGLDSVPPTAPGYQEPRTGAQHGGSPGPRFAPAPFDASGAGAPPPYNPYLHNPYLQGQGPAARQAGRIPPRPTQVFVPRPSAAAAQSGAVAITGLVALLFVPALLSFLGTLSYVSPTEDAKDGFGATPVGVFIDSWLLTPLPFVLAAYAAFVFILPIVRQSPLPTILIRAVLAGAAGTVVLMIIGLFTGFAKSIRDADWSWLLTDFLTDPIANGVSYTAVLLGTATVAWLWLGRPRRGRGPAVHQGMPGTVPPADAIPPATVPRQPAQYQQFGGPAPQQPGGAQQSAPAPTWGASQQSAPAPTWGVPQAPPSASSAPHGQWGPPRDGDGRSQH